MDKKGRYLLTLVILSYAFGWVGADRFYRGEVALGVLKLVTLGGFGIWYAIDALVWTYQLGQHDSVK